MYLDLPAESKLPQTIVVALTNGFYSATSGAGYSNRSVLRILSHDVAPVRLVVAPARVRPGSVEYDPDWYAATSAVLSESAEIRPVDNGTNGRTASGGVAHRERLCAAAAGVISTVVRDDPQAVVLALDAPLLGLSRHLPDDAAARLLLVLRSSATLTRPDHDPGRPAWELAGLRDAANRGGRIGAISSFMRRHLIDDCGLPGEAVLDVPNGLMPDEWTPAPPDPGLLPRRAESGFILAMGRAVPYKGFDDLLDALALLRNRRCAVPHTVLAATSSQPGLTSYQQHLADRIVAEELDVSLLTRFSPRVRSLLRHPALAAVVVPSRVEPFGRIPIEAFAAGAGPVVATSAGGLSELVIEAVTGFSAPAARPPALAATLSRALSAEPSAKARLAESGRALVELRHDYPRTIAAALHTLAGTSAHAQAVSGARP